MHNRTMVTDLLIAWGNGDEAAFEQLVPLVYQELRLIARRQLRGERAGHSLPSAALVNETYLRLIDAKAVSWQDRAHFMAVCSRAMRRILVDHARSRRAQKRGGSAPLISLDDIPGVAAKASPDVVALDDALQALAGIDERKSRVVELRFFGGMTVDETAAVLKISPETVMRDWQFAKQWLGREMRRGNQPAAVVPEQ